MESEKTQHILTQIVNILFKKKAKEAPESYNITHIRWLSAVQIIKNKWRMLQ